MSVNTQAETSVSIKSPLVPSGTPLLLLLFFGALSAIGLYAAATILIQGQSVLATSNEVPWNIFVSAYEFFVVISTGLFFMAAIGYALGIERFQIIAKRAVASSLILLAVGMAGIMMDIGRPWMAINMMLSPNLQSPMFWMVSLYGLYALMLVMSLFAINQGDKKVIKKWITVGSFVALIATGTLGALFGMLYAKDLWFGEYMSIYFILSAIVSGLAALSMFVYFSYGATKKSIPSKLNALLPELGKLLAFALGALLFFIFWKTIAGLYAGKVETSMLVFGKYAINFWLFEIIIGILVPLFILANKSMRTNGGILISAVMVLIGVLVARYNLIIVGQLVRPYEQELATYSANSIEIMYVLGLFGFAGFLYMIASSFLKFDKYEEQA